MSCVSPTDLGRLQILLTGSGEHLRDGMITHLEPDILECEVKWALGSITTNKASGGDEIPVELFQILKDDAVKVNSAEGPRPGADFTVCVFLPIRANCEPVTTGASRCFGPM